MRTFTSVEEIGESFRTFGDIFANVGRFHRYFRWLCEVWSLGQSSTIRNYLQYLGHLLDWDRLRTSDVAFRQQLEAVIHEVRHKRTMPALQEQGRAVDIPGFVAVSTAAQAVLEAFQKRVPAPQHNSDDDDDWYDTMMKQRIERK